MAEDTFTLRIVSDGTPHGTQILDQDGRRLKRVTGVAWGLDLKGMATARFQVLAVPVDLVVPDIAPDDISFLQLDDLKLTPEVEVEDREEAPVERGPNGPVPPSAGELDPT